MQKPMSIQEQVKQNEVLYFALLAGQLGIAIVLFLFIENPAAQSANGASGSNFEALIIALFCASAIGMSFFLYNKRKESGRQLKGSLEEKLVHYRQSFIMRAAMIEGVNLVALIFYFFVEKNYVYLLLFALGIGAFLLIRPTVDRMAEDYQLSANEQNELRSLVK